MATFNQMLASFSAILLRDDCLPPQATIFLQQAITRITRECRLPSMERALIVTAGEALTLLPVPADFIEAIDLTVSGDGLLEPHALRFVSQRDLIRIPTQFVGYPRCYSRFQAQFNIAPAVPQGATAQLSYYGDFSPFATPDSSNEISASSPDLVVYGALSFAADAFQHPSAEQWEARYQQILMQVQMQGYDADSKGGYTAINPMYYHE